MTRFYCGFIVLQHSTVVCTIEKLSISQQFFVSLRIKQVFVLTLKCFLGWQSERRVSCFSAAIPACHGSHVLWGPGRTWPWAQRWNNRGSGTSAAAAECRCCFFKAPFQNRMLIWFSWVVVLYCFFVALKFIFCQCMGKHIDSVIMKTLNGL